MPKALGVTDVFISVVGSLKENLPPENQSYDHFIDRIFARNKTF